MKNNNKLFVTAPGLKKLKDEYQQLLNVRRKEVARRIQLARELGDITENSEYESALEEQAFIEGKISELAEIIKEAEIIATAASGQVTVSLGSKVRIHLDGNEHEFEIVGELEADPTQNKISHESPMGKALLGKKIGEKIEVEAPVGKITYTILRII